MPAQPLWFHRLDEILAELRHLDQPYLDRLAVERLFRIGARRARQLMAPVASIQIGNAAAVSRPALLAHLERLAQSDRLHWELRRRARVVEELDRTRRHLAARQVRLPAAPSRSSRLLQDLPSGIELQPGTLRVTFEGAEDLAAKLFALSQAMADDWPAFSEAVGG